MGFLIVIGIGWALAHAVEGKAAEYRAAQEQRWKALNKDLKKQHPSWGKSRRARALWWGARRNAVGHFAYQVRHGWWPVIADMRDGFSAARRQHHEWLQRREETGEPTPTLRAAIRAGWERAKQKFRRRGETNGEAAEGEAPTTEPEPKPASRVKGTTVRKLHAVGAGTSGAGSTRGERMSDTMTGEATTIGTYRAHLDATASAARERLEEARAEMDAADREISAHEATNANLLAAGLGTETAGGMTDLMDAAMQRKTAAQQRLQAAEQAVANADAAKAALKSQGHENVEAAVQGATATVADTSFYKG